MMKKLAILMLIAGAFLLSSCDTIETTSITVQLGSERGTAAPGDVSTAHIAVYQHTGMYYEGSVGAAVATKSVSASGSATLVVPANMNLLVVVMALNESKELYYYGEGLFEGAANHEEPRKRGPIPTEDNVVRIEMESHSTNWTVEPGPQPVNVFQEGAGFYVECNNVPDLQYYYMYTNYLSQISEIIVERKIDPGSFIVIDRIPVSGTLGEPLSYYTYFDPWPNGEIPPPGTRYTYLVTLRVPALGFTFYGWAEGSYTTPPAEIIN